MQRYSRTHLSDPILLQSATANAGRERTATADLLADLAEIDARKLYLPAGYASMFAFCVGRLHLWEQAAFKRIAAARAAARFPAIFDAVATGRLHLSAVVLLAPHLTEDTADQLLAAAASKSKAEIERLLAERFPKSDVLAWVTPATPVAAGESHAPEHVQLSPGIVESVHPVHRVTPLSSQTFSVQFTMSQKGHEHLRYAQALLGHTVPSGDIAQVVERALTVYVTHLEKQKFAATSRPRRRHERPSSNPRHIPARVKHAVWERDGGRCTFVSETGHRCEATRPLEFDHVTEVARGGEATVDGIRLLCRAHNQHAAEGTFGAEFMRHQRIAAAERRAAAAKARGARAGSGPAACAMRAPGQLPPQPVEDHAQDSPPAAGAEADDRDVVPWLRALGFSAAEARRAAERCADMPPEATIEERVRMALKCIRVRGTRFVPAPAGNAMSPGPVSAR